MFSPELDEQLEVILSMGVPEPHAQYVAVLFAVVRLLQLWGTGRLLVFMRSEYVLLGVGRKILHCQWQQWTTPHGSLSSVLLWEELIKVSQQPSVEAIFVQVCEGAQVITDLKISPAP